MGVNMVPVPTHVEDGYHLPPRAEIEKRIGPRTRAILMCSPNNPTGTVYSDAEIDTLASICRDRGIFLVSDEVYREFVYDGRTHRSVLTLDGLDDLAIVVDSVSKRYSLCGARIGNIVSRNKPFMDTILRFGQARLCPPTIEQWACLGLTDVPLSYTRGVIAEYQKRRDVVSDALANIRRQARSPRARSHPPPVVDGLRSRSSCCATSVDGETRWWRRSALLRHAGSRARRGAPTYVRSRTSCAAR